jgi:type 1 glutamine amidotransferase/HEAT repeat protein
MTLFPVKNEHRKVRTMTRQRTTTHPFMLGLVLLLLTIASSTVVADEIDIPDDTVAKIDAAIPEDPSVKPEQPRHVLIYSQCSGFRHGCIPYANYALKRLGERTGAYDAVIGEDSSVFRPESLKRFDAIIFNNATGTLFTDSALRKSLMEFVRSGKGVVGIHAATDCFYDWEEFGEMMGGYFDGHPWHETVTIKLDDPDHPLLAAFGGEPFVVKDEIYQFRPPYSRDSLRVLMSLDTSKVDMSKPGINRRDHDFAVSWVSSWGKGRVFYCSLGHRNEIFWNPTVLRHYLDGIQFALGDLEADTTPSAELAHHDDDAMSLNEALDAASSYEFGASRLPLSVIEEHVRDATENDVKRIRLVRELLALLQADRTTDDCKSFICRQLALIGGPESTDALGELLHDEKLSHMARYALERIPDAKAAQTLSDAAWTLESERLLGVINSVARRDPQQLGPLPAISKHDESPVAMALLEWIARTNPVLANHRIGPAIHHAAERGEHDHVTELLRLHLICADSLLRDGLDDEAVEIYRGILFGDAPGHLQLAALRGLVRAQPSDTAPIIAGLLEDDDPVLRGAAARLITESSGEGIARTYANLMPDLSLSARVAMIEALGERVEDPDALTAVMIGLLDSTDREVGDAAIRAMGNVGDGSCVVTLAELAGSGSEDAQHSLATTRADDVDDALAAALENPLAEVRTACAIALGARRASEHASQLVRTAGNDIDPGVRTAALESLSAIAPPETLPRLVNLLVIAQSDAERDRAIEAVTATALRSDDAERRARIVAGAMREADGPTRAALLTVLGELGGTTALRTVREAIRRESGEVGRAALDALAAWPDGDAAQPLYEIARKATDPTQRTMAFEGYVRVVSLPDERRAADTAAMLGRAHELARSDDEHRVVLAALADVPDPAALELAVSHLDDPNLAGSAATSAISIARAIGETHRSLALEAIDRVVSSESVPNQVREAAGAAVNHIERNDDFITAWRFAGPYMKEKIGGGSLIGIAFAPESPESASAIEWTEMPAAAYSEPGIFDLMKVAGGGDRCAYLRTEIVSDREQRARLEIGSDDGVKVWLNGMVVHENNVMRGLTVGQDVVNVTLRKGVNTLMMKITQGGGDWKACCRIRAVDGFALDGVTIRAPD